MGGHGGLNILPQKRWNVYNYENREKVRKDEEAAAREEQLRLEQSRRCDAEHRLERLRNARGVPSPSPLAPSSDSHHINLFDGLPGFSSLASARSEKEDPKKSNEEGRDPKNSKKRKREERPPTVGPEDEKYKLGYGLAGKGVKAPWYLSKPSAREEVDEENDGKGGSSSGSGKKSGGGKKTIDELREERMKRERQEKERVRALLSSVGKKGADRGSSRR